MTVSETDSRAATEVENVDAVQRPEEQHLWRQTLTVANREYTLMVRNRWALALTLLFAGLSLLVGVLGQQNGVIRADAVVVSLVELSTLLLPLLALAFGYDAIVGADEAGSLGILFALPIPRRYVLTGIYLGRLLTFGGAVIIGFGVGGLRIAMLGGLPSGYLGLVGAAVLAGAAFLALSVLISTLAAEKTHALGGVLLLWVWFALVHDVLALAVVAADLVPANWLGAFLLANPAAVFRVLALQAVPTATGGMADVLAGTGVTPPVLIAALLTWTVVPTWLAGRLVARRSV
ncbi:hypothetical protein Halar_1533 [halophilic archaeon DL31]|jgi:Cu-processing system permease protein|nr:hypothetical protein Halar_1533 [halophilic archaeon DL31]